MARYTKLALIIGNDTYAHPEQRLRTCVNDARDVRNSLQSIGFHTQYATNLRLKSMQANTRQFVQSIQPGSIALFYFSGHGLQYNGINYLSPIDSGAAVVLEDLDQSALNVEELIKSMHQKNPRLVLIILDSCRAYGTASTSDQIRLFNRASAKIKDGLAPMQAPPATIIVYACAADQTSTTLSKNNKNSLYTYHLLRHICTPNTDIDLVLRMVAADVQRDRLNKKHQAPFRYSSCNEIICLAGNRGRNVPVLPGHLPARPVIQPFIDQHGQARAAGHHHHPQKHISRHRHHGSNNDHLVHMRSPSNALGIPERSGLPGLQQFHPRQR